MDSSHYFDQCRDSLADDHRLQKWRMAVTDVRFDRTPARDIASITHGSGGEEVVKYTGSWNRRSQIGGGGSGVVYCEAHTTTPQVRAVKQLLRSNHAWAKREIDCMLWAKKFPRLFVKFHCWYQFGGSTYIAMEYHERGDIGSFVRHSGACEDLVARRIAEQILQGIFVLHEYKFTHRDIKPENILIASISPIVIKLADFGGTKQFQASTQTVSGTRGWMAPEVPSEIYDQMIDMWSFGCVVYFLLTSLKPFDEGDCGGDDPATIRKYVFPFWPRISSRNFQAGDTRIPGDQIIARGIRNSANHFLGSLIIADPTKRLSALNALSHDWITERTQRTPQYSALLYGDLPLTCLLSRHEASGNGDWLPSYTPRAWQIILRAAAASGNAALVDRAIRQIPKVYNFTYVIPKWPMVPALLGAATIGELKIVATLLRRLAPVERSHLLLLKACKAALNGRHHPVVQFLWPALSLRDRAWDRQLILDIVCFATAPFLHDVINYWKLLNPPNRNGLVWISDSSAVPTAFSYYFQGMLESVAERGSLGNLEVLLKAKPMWNLVPGPELLSAITVGDCDKVKLLFESYQLQSDSSSTPHSLFAKALTHASLLGHIEIVKYLVEWGVVPDNEAIEVAAEKHNTAICRYLVEKRGLDVLIYIPSIAFPHCGLPFLKWLCSNLLDSSYPWDLTAHVYEAAYVGDQDMVTWLLAKADGTAIKGPCMVAAFRGASERGHISVVEHLCHQYAAADVVEAWVGAATGGHVEVLELLLANNPNPPKKTLIAALAAAVDSRRLGAVLQLLCAGACINKVHAGKKEYRDKAIEELMHHLGSGQLSIATHG